MLSFQGSKTNFYLKAHLLFRVQKFIKKIVSETIQFHPYCPFKELIETSTVAHIFYGVQTVIKKLDLRHYGLTHILLSFQGSYSKFPPTSHMFLVLKNSFKKLYQGQYGLTHIGLTQIVLSRILCKCSPMAHILFGVKNVLKNYIRDSVV